jgi:Heavy-metal resistance protein CzcE
MSKLTLALAAAGLTTCVAAGAAVPKDLLGDATTANQAERTIRITPSTRYVNVRYGESIEFDAAGHRFSWHFDGPVNEFPLNRVAPPGALDHAVTAYVERNPESDE